MKISFTEHHLFQILKRFENQYLPFDLFLSNYFRANKALGAKDRNTIAEAAYGMTRWLLLIDHLIGVQPSWEKRYAVFQAFQPASLLLVNSIPLNVRMSFPFQLFSLLKRDYGEEKAIYLCQICNTPAPVAIRANLLKTTRDKLLERWNGVFEITPCKLAPHGIQFKQRASLTALPEFKEGLFEIQDEASQLVADIVSPAPGEHVLDYCAGSGGKTLGFAHKMQNKGQIYLHDIRPMILEQARKRMKRAGIENVQFLNSSHPQLSKLKKKMDWVVVDVPCTGTGTLRRNPDQKWKFTNELLERLVGEQRVIFEKALSFVKPGGKILYSTCSFLKDENENQLEHFLKTYDLELIGEPFQSFPVSEGMDGFYAALLLKRS